MNGSAARVSASGARRLVQHLLHRQFLERPAVVAAGVVDQQVQRAEAAFDGAQHLVRACDVGRIPLDRGDAIRCSECGHGLVEPGAVAPSDRNIGACGEQRPRERESHAGAAAGDQRGPALQIHRVGSLRDDRRGIVP